MKQKWKIIIGKNNAKYYSVFEGDVLDMLRVKREYAGIVEIGPLNSFDITSTLAKVLGLRNDY